MERRDRIWARKVEEEGRLSNGSMRGWRKQNQMNSNSGTSFSIEYTLPTLAQLTEICSGSLVAAIWGLSFTRLIISIPSLRPTRCGTENKSWKLSIFLSRPYKFWRVITRLFGHHSGLLLPNNNTAAKLHDAIDVNMVTYWLLHTQVFERKHGNIVFRMAQWITTTFSL